MIRIRTNDTVLVISGKDKGKTGAVLHIDFDKNKVKVQGVAIVTKHAKAKRQGEVSAIKQQEGYIDLSNVMLISPKDNKPCRVKFKLLESGEKVRVCSRTNEII